MWDFTCVFLLSFIRMPPYIWCIVANDYLHKPTGKEFSINLFTFYKIAFVALYIIKFFYKSHCDGFDAAFQIVRCSIVFWPIKRWTVTSTVFDVSPVEKTITLTLTRYYANVLTYFLLEQVCCTILFRMKIKLDKN